MSEEPKPETFSDIKSDPNYEVEYASLDEIKEIVTDMRALADKLERLAETGKISKSTLKIIWEGFATAESDANNYLEE